MTIQKNETELIAFDDSDAVETYLGRPAASMTADELVAYVRTFMDVVHGIDLPVSGEKERAVMAKLKRTYGADAGRIVKWVLWRHRGVFRDHLVTVFDFASGRKWWTDLMYVELQRESAKKKKRIEASSAQFSTIGDL